MGPKQGRGRGTSSGGRGRGGRTEDSAPSWKRASGAGISTKAKKEYLQWKRQQRAARQGSSTSEDEGEGTSAPTPLCDAATRRRQASHGNPRDVREAKNEGDISDASEQTTESSDDEGSSGAAHSEDGINSSGDPSERDGSLAGAQGGGGGAPVTAAQRARAADAEAARKHAGDARNAPPSAADMEAPLVYRQLADVVQLHTGEGGDGTCAQRGGGVSDGSDEGRPPPPTRAVRLQEAEVGQTEEGRSLGMPTRPAWQGVARTAEQLQALEEASFASWQQGLEGRFGAQGAGRLSFYETRLEFWRQLWRTLEMSDAVVVIVDARNPLLHFSEALYRHVTRDLGLPTLLLLNKCDLVHPAAAAAWRRWFEAHHPGLAVLPVSAAPGSAAETQREVLRRLMEMRVMRRGEEVKVADVVGMPLDKVIVESIRRNTHAKRHALPEAKRQPPRDASTGRQARGGAGGEPDGGGNVGGSGSEEGMEGWTVKGTKAAKKDAQRRKRRAWAGAARAGVAPAVNARQHSEGCGRAGDGGKRQQHPPLGDSGGSSDVCLQHVDDEEEREEEEEEEEEAALREVMELLTLEGRLRTLSATGASGAPPALPSAPAAEAAQAAEGPQPPKAGAAAGVAAAVPVVVCLVGEPNVGKSSTLNALLGSHRVAVSSHPGRTKHYQTHYVCGRLVLCDCPGLIFPRLDVSLPMQVLFGSFPIAHCRNPYSVVRYMAERIWPRLQDSLRLHLPQPEGKEDAAAAGGGSGGRAREGGGCSSNGRDGGAGHDASGPSAGGWSPLALCEALAERHNWRSRRGGRPDVYRAANWLLRGALAGKHGLVMSFLPPADDEGRR